jgi:hypothetical protein
VAGRLERALRVSATQAGTELDVAEHRTDAWRSATFAGDRHIVEGSAPSGPALDRWLAALPTLDLPVPGHVVAELSLAACRRSGDVTRFRIDGLTVAVA